jgi:hypothetical protein
MDPRLRHRRRVSFDRGCQRLAEVVEPRGCRESSLDQQPSTSDYTARSELNPKSSGIERSSFHYPKLSINHFTSPSFRIRSLPPPNQLPRFHLRKPAPRNHPCSPQARRHPSYQPSLHRSSSRIFLPTRPNLPPLNST